MNGKNDSALKNGVEENKEKNHEKVKKEVPENEKLESKQTDQEESPAPQKTNTNEKNNENVCIFRKFVEIFKNTLGFEFGRGENRED